MDTHEAHARRAVEGVTRHTQIHTASAPLTPEKAFLTVTARVGDTTAAEGANVRAAIALGVLLVQSALGIG